MTEAGRRVLVLTFENAQLLDVTGPLQVFATANDLLVAQGSRPSYEIVAMSRQGGLVATSSGLALGTVPIDEEPLDTLIVAGGRGTRKAIEDPILVAWVRGRAAAARRTASVCSGAFLLAAAGLLDGRRAATHWVVADELQQRFPAVTVEPDPIFVQDGNIWSSAGITAGIDLALALVQEDLGHDTAMRVARHLVVFLKRPGTQAQFSVPLATQMAEDESFSPLHAWIGENLAADLRVENLADRCGMSPRSFARAYVARMGETPARMVEAMRVEAARRALEMTGRSLKEVARHCGFGDEERMRRAFHRRVGVCPLDYRQRFAIE